MNNNISRRIEDRIALCWKCDGKGNLPHFRHVAGGLCFACDGSGRCSIRQYTDGLMVTESVIMFLLDGRRGSGLHLHDGRKRTATGDGGLMNKARKDSLDLIKGGLDVLKRGYHYEYDYDGNCTGKRGQDVCPRDYVDDAIRLACLNDERANERAIAYVGGEAGEKLRAALAGANAAMAIARRVCDERGWERY